MKLNNLQIEYFRCFLKYNIDFAPGITVLIGRNGAGKSTLINAIHKALSFIFKKDTTVREDMTLTSGIPSLKVEPFNRKTDLERDYKTGLAYPYISIKSKGTFFQKELSWEMYTATSTFSMQPKKYAEAFREFMDVVHKENQLPILAFYSDSFPHIASKESEITKELSSLRNFGYYQWNEESACSSIWIERFKKTWTIWDRLDRKAKDIEQSLRNSDFLLEKEMISKEEYEEDTAVRKEIIPIIEERNEVGKEIDAITECLRTFTKNDSLLEVKEFFLSVYDEELCLETTKGDNPHFEKLPAGYKRLIYMVFDIAYRSYILNGNTNSQGVVIIDEIDLHLHPSLEQHVLQRLRETFPNIQFIVSTHSALVISNLDTSNNEEGIQENRVYVMEADSERPVLLPNLYGVDYNATMRDFMGTPDRNEDIKYLIDEFLSFKELEMQTEAESTYRKIKEIVGDDNAILNTIREQKKD